MPRRGVTAEPTATELATARTRDGEAVQLALAGATYDQIAERLGYANRGGAWKAVRRALDRHEAGDVLALRDQELARLDLLQLGVWQKAVRGDVQALDRVLRIMERRARLLGLDHADGIAERRVQLEEDQADLVVSAFETLLRLRGLDPADPQVRLDVQRALTGVVVEEDTA